VDDEKSAAILQTVFGGNGTKPVVKPKAQKEKKPRKKGYKVLDGEFAGQEFTGASIAKMLKTGKIRIGANLIHSRKGRFQVNMNLNGKYVLLPIGEPA
jgi:hypothetical protein